MPPSAAELRSDGLVVGRRTSLGEPGQAALFRRSFNFPTRAGIPAAVRFNFTAMWMIDALDSSSDLRSSSSSGVHILLVLSGTLITLQAVRRLRFGRK
jgi:hypothetical protein